MLLDHRCSHLVQPGGEGAPRVTDFRPLFASHYDPLPSGSGVAGPEGHDLSQRVLYRASVASFC